jgi:hypothetical protein
MVSNISQLKETRMNVHYTSLAAVRNVDQPRFDAMFKKCFHEACEQMPKNELIKALCVNQRELVKLKKAA